MDLIFGSAGVAAAETEKLAAINKEIGLEDLLAGRRGESGSERNEKTGDLVSVGEGREKVESGDEIQNIEKS